MDIRSLDPFEVERFPNAAGESPSVELTFVCVDIVAFTAMTERLGDRAALGVVRELARTIRGQAEHRRGRVLEIRGDSFLVAFPDPLEGVGFALAVQREAECRRYGGERLGLRTCVHHGTVLEDGRGYFGRELVVPYRVLSCVEAGGVGITEAACARLPRPCLAPAARIRGHVAKGLAEPLDFRVLGRGAVHHPALLALTGLSDPGRSIH